VINDIPSLFRSLAEPHQYSYVCFEIRDRFFCDEAVYRYGQRWEKEMGIKPRVLSGQTKKVFGQLMEPSLFQEPRLWMVSLSSFRSKDLSQLVSVIDVRGANDSFLCFSHESISKELIKNADLMVSISALKPWDRLPLLIQLTAAFYRKQGKTITKDAATFLVENFGQERESFFSELEKVLLYCWSGSSISLHDVEMICDGESRHTMWQLLDALFARNSQQIAQIISQAVDWNEIALLRFLRNQIEKSIVAVEAGASPRNKSQARQLQAVRERGSQYYMRWIDRLETKELELRTGREQFSLEVLLPFFISLL